jgi:hypothetical protein
MKENSGAVLYAQYDNDDKGNFSRCVGYEVHIKRFREARKIKSKLFNHTIRRPCDEDFGTWAWSFRMSQFEKASKKMHALSRG